MLSHGSECPLISAIIDASPLQAAGPLRADTVIQFSHVQSFRITSAT